jgi:hypothetical protein
MSARLGPRRRPPAKRSPHVGTLGSTIRIGHSLTIICGKWECHHRATLDLEALAAKLGNERRRLKVVGAWPRGTYVCRVECFVSGMKNQTITTATDPIRAMTRKSAVRPKLCAIRPDSVVLMEPPMPDMTPTSP